MDPQLLYLIGLPIGATAGIIGAHVGYHLCCASRDAKYVSYAAVVLFSVLSIVFFRHIGSAPPPEFTAPEYASFLTDIGLTGAITDLASTISRFGFYAVTALEFFSLAVLYGIMRREADLSPRSLQRVINKRKQQRKV